MRAAACRRSPQPAAGGGEGAARRRSSSSSSRLGSRRGGGVGLSSNGIEPQVTSSWWHRRLTGPAAPLRRFGRAPPSHAQPFFFAATCSAHGLLAVSRSRRHGRTGWIVPTAVVSSAPNDMDVNTPTRRGRMRRARLRRRPCAALLWRRAAVGWASAVAAGCSAALPTIHAAIEDARVVVQKREAICSARVADPDSAEFQDYANLCWCVAHSDGKRYCWCYC